MSAPWTYNDALSDCCGAPTNTDTLICGECGERCGVQEEEEDMSKQEVLETIFEKKLAIYKFMGSGETELPRYNRDWNDLIPVCVKLKNRTKAILEAEANKNYQSLSENEKFENSPSIIWLSTIIEDTIEAEFEKVYHHIKQIQANV